MDAARDPYAAIARFYDLATDGYDDDLPFYRELAPLNATVLDLGVGTGRVALALADGARRIVGIDRSPAMLALAVGKLAAHAIRPAQLQLLAGEMATPPLRGRFDLALCALNTFLHLARPGEQLAALRAWRELLAPDGLLALDLPGPGGDWGDWNPGERPLLPAWTRVVGAESVTRLTTFSADPAEQLRFYTDLYDNVGADGIVRRATASYALRWLFPAEALLLLEAAGLELQERYGGYALEPFDAASERMLLVARRTRSDAPSSGPAARGDALC
jgi:SAM-dependent methyltransferase